MKRPELLILVNPLLGAMPGKPVPSSSVSNDAAHGRGWRNGSISAETTGQEIGRHWAGRA